MLAMDDYGIVIALLSTAHWLTLLSSMIDNFKDLYFTVNHIILQFSMTGYVDLRRQILPF